MEGTAWRGGETCYGVRVSRADRDTYFSRHWTSVTLRLPDADVRVTITPSFWRRCTELRSRAIRDWFVAEGLIPWPERMPPKFALEPDGEATFRLRLLT